MMEAIKAMKILLEKSKQTIEGKVGYALLWLLGVPLPILAIIFLARGCN